MSFSSVSSCKDIGQGIKRVWLVSELTWVLLGEQGELSFRCFLWWVECLWGEVNLCQEFVFVSAVVD